MSTELIEQKLAELNRRVESLESARSKCPPEKETWKELIGTSKGDALDREAGRLGAEWRSQENARG